MTKIKVALLKGSRDNKIASGVDYFTLNLYKELKSDNKVDVSLIYGNYFLPGMFKFLHFNNLNQFDVVHNCVPGLGPFIRTKKNIITTFYDDIMFLPEIYTKNLSNIQKAKKLATKKMWSIALAKDIERSKIITAISEQSKKALEKRFNLNGKMVYVIPPGIQTDLFKPSSSILKSNKKRPLRLFYCGRLCFRKGTDLMLDALSFFKNKDGVPKIELYLAGVEGENFNLKGEIKKRKLDSIVHYLGRLSEADLVSNYNISDIFVFPSRIEGYGIPPLEALSCGLKVVSTNVPSVESFEQIIKVDANVRSIAQGILKAQNLKVEKQKAHSLIKEKYSIQSTAKSYTKIYKEALL